MAWIRGGWRRWLWKDMKESRLKVWCGSSSKRFGFNIYHINKRNFIVFSLHFWNRIKENEWNTMVLMNERSRYLEWIICINGTMNVENELDFYLIPVFIGIHSTLHFPLSHSILKMFGVDGQQLEYWHGNI